LSAFSVKLVSEVNDYKMAKAGFENMRIIYPPTNPHTTSNFRDPIYKFTALSMVN
jgi:hypothetical protein